MDAKVDKDSEEVEANCNECKWQWRPGTCYKKSIFRNSFLQNCNLPENEAFHCMWLWSHKVTSSTTAQMLIWDEDTVGEWCRFFRQMISQMVDNHAEGEGAQLGGIGAEGERIIVEVDESKFGKRKHNRGRRVTANWVVGMVEKIPQRRCAMVVVHKREASVCMAVIGKCVKPGSIMHSDSWGGRNPISKQTDKNCKHYKLIHSKEFVVKHSDGHICHTQMIEGNWGAQMAAMLVHKRNGEDSQDCLFEFMWRRANAGNLWDALMDGLRKCRYAIAELHGVDEVDVPWEPTDVLINVCDCEDYDSAATEETETEDEDGNNTEGIDNNNGQGRGAARARRAEMPTVEAVPSAVIFVQERLARQQQEEMDRQLAGTGGRKSKDGEKGTL